MINNDLIYNNVYNFISIYNIPMIDNFTINIDKGNIKKIIHGYADYLNNQVNIVINNDLYNSCNIEEKFEYKKMVHNVIMHELVHLVLYQYNENLSEFLPIEIQQKYGMELDKKVIKKFTQYYLSKYNGPSMLDRYIKYNKEPILLSIRNRYNKYMIDMRSKIVDNYGKRNIKLNSIVHETLYGAHFLDINIDEKIEYNKMLEDISRSSIGFIYNISKFLNGYDYSECKILLDRLFKDVTNYDSTNSIYIADLIDNFLIDIIDRNISMI